MIIAERRFWYSLKCIAYEKYELDTASKNRLIRIFGRRGKELKQNASQSYIWWIDFIFSCRINSFDWIYFCILQNLHMNIQIGYSNTVATVWHESVNRIWTRVRQLFQKDATFAGGSCALFFVATFLIGSS